MKKLIFLIPVIFLILATTLTKNSTKTLDKKIFETKENIRALENRLELELLDYNFLTSPKKLMEYQTKFFENNLIQLKISNIKNLEDLNNKIINNE